MATRRVLKSVLSGFLGTYTSRYSTYRGFWLFGFLVERLDRMEIDLLAQVGREEESPERARARGLAAQRFADQLSKSGLDSSIVRDARLVVQRQADDESVPGQHFRSGYNIRFRATAVTDTGQQFEQERVVFVAPHD